MNDENILELIDKIIGYADNQPLILNHLSVLREKVSDLLAQLRHAQTANEDLQIDKETREAQIGHLQAQLEHLRHDLQDARAKIEQLKQKPQMTAESVEILPSRRVRGLENL
jgi:chromosome segregation ATPase